MWRVSLESQLIEGFVDKRNWLLPLLLVLLCLQGATYFPVVSCSAEVKCQFMGSGPEGYWMLVVVLKSIPG